MPFATTNVRRSNLGGGHKITTGDWTGQVGDATGTIVVQGGVVHAAEFRENLAGSTIRANWSDAAGTAGNTRTLTVENIAAVTAGKFWILHS